MNNILQKSHGNSYFRYIIFAITAHIVQNIAERCQEYFLYFIVIKILSQNFCQILQFQLSEIFLKTNKYLILLEIF